MRETLLEATPKIRSVIPGVIRPVRDAKGKVPVRVTVQNGWKAIAPKGQKELEQAFQAAGAVVE